MGGRKLGARPKSPVLSVETTEERLVAGIEVGCVQVAPGLAGLKFPEAFHDGLSDLSNLGPFLLPDGREVRQKLHH